MTATTLFMKCTLVLLAVLVTQVVVVVAAAVARKCLRNARSRRAVLEENADNNDMYARSTRHVISTHGYNGTIAPGTLEHSFSLSALGVQSGASLCLANSSQQSVQGAYKPYRDTRR